MGDRAGQPPCRVCHAREVVLREELVMVPQMVGLLHHHQRRPRQLVLFDTLERHLRDSRPPTLNSCLALRVGAA